MTAFSAANAACGLRRTQVTPRCVHRVYEVIPAHARVTTSDEDSESDVSSQRHAVHGAAGADIETPHTDAGSAR